MSLPESLRPDTPYQPEAPAPSPSLQPETTIFDKFNAMLQPYMDIADHQPLQKRRALGIVFKGKLLRPADEVYTELNPKIEAEGFSLYLQRQAGLDEVLVVDGILVARNIRTSWLLHLVLLVLAILTTTFTGGAMLRGYLWSDVKAALDAQDTNRLWDIFQAGLVFTSPLLLILGTHEMGHYLVARLHKVKVTLPFFIPLPLWGSLGTLGAVIFIQSPFRNRKMLFDIGIAGPLAGLVVSAIVFLVGLNHPYSYDYPAYFLDLGINRVTVPPFLEWLAQLVWDSEKIANIDRIVFYHRPEAMAGWFGILLTSLNLLPLGQFDGGHIAFAMLGRRIAWTLALLAAVICIYLGLTSGWIGWLVWPIMAMLTGLRHPPPHDDITPIGLPRMILGILTFALFLAMIVVVPFYSTIR